MKNFIIITTLVIAVLVFGIQRFISSNQKTSTSFFMKNGLICKFDKSTDSKNLGKSIALSNLTTKEPQIVFSDGGMQKWNVVSETDGILVIGMVATSTGSTDTITLLKKTGKFERESKGDLGSGYSISSSGYCN